MSTYRTIVQQTYDQPVARVWDAWTIGEQWGSWFSEGPAQVDLRIGGRYSTPDGDAGVYLAIERHRLLRFTWEHPHHQPGSVVTLRFTALAPNKTRLVLVHSRLNATDACDMQQGWRWAKASLGHYLETGKGLKEAEWLKLQQ